MTKFYLFFAILQIPIFFILIKSASSELQLIKILFIYGYSLISIIILLITIKEYFIKKKSINNLIHNGKISNAYITDYIFFQYMQNGKGNHYYFPLLEFYDENNILHKHLYPHITSHHYNIGDIVKIYYHESEGTKFEQLNFETNIFMGKIYGKISIITKDDIFFTNLKKGICYYGSTFLSSPVQITSEIKKENIENLPPTTIQENDILIDGTQKYAIYSPIITFLFIQICMLPILIFFLFFI